MSHKIITYDIFDEMLNNINYIKLKTYIKLEKERWYYRTYNIFFLLYKNYAI